MFFCSGFLYSPNNPGREAPPCHLTLEEGHWGPCPVLPAGVRLPGSRPPLQLPGGCGQGGLRSCAVPATQAGPGFWPCSPVACLVGFRQPFAPKPRHPQSHPGQVAGFPSPSTTTNVSPELLAQKRRGKGKNQGRPGGSAVEHLSSAQGMILGSQGRVPHQAPCMEPASPSACVSDSLSSVSLTNK